MHFPTPSKGRNHPKGLSQQPIWSQHLPPNRITKSHYSFSTRKLKIHTLLNLEIPTVPVRDISFPSGSSSFTTKFSRRVVNGLHQLKTTCGMLNQNIQHRKLENPTKGQKIWIKSSITLRNHHHLRSDTPFSPLLLQHPKKKKKSLNQELQNPNTSILILQEDN